MLKVAVDTALAAPDPFWLLRVFYEGFENNL